MFLIEELTSTDCKTLIHSDDIFHKALEGGENRYHVKDSVNGDYDIVYIENDSLNPYMPAFQSFKRIPDYFYYDENQTESLVLDMYKEYRKLSCEEVNEYTVVIAKVLINMLNYDVYFTDAAVLRFISGDKVHVTEKLPDDDKVFYIQKKWNTGLSNNIFNHLSATYAFHNIFLLQYMLNGRKLSDIKYLAFQISEKGGIGAVLENVNKFSAAFSKYGIKVIFTDDKVGRFKRTMLEKYFNSGAFTDDSNEGNTIYIIGDMSVQIIMSYFIQSQKAGIDKSILNEKFRSDMDEYFNAVFGDKKVLGVLIRGSDYIAAGLSGVRKQATAEEMIPEINKWLEEEKYDSIFLATEDSDVLKQMKSVYGNRLKAISQERFSISDFKDLKLIYDYEKENAQGEEYDISVEDTTINYFYALYFLSKCDAFMCSGQCNGYYLVNSLKDGKFKKLYKFSVGM